MFDVGQQRGHQHLVGKLDDQEVDADGIEQDIERPTQLRLLEEVAVEGTHQNGEEADTDVAEVFEEGVHGGVGVGLDRLGDEGEERTGRLHGGESQLIEHRIDGAEHVLAPMGCRGGLEGVEGGDAAQEVEDGETVFVDTAEVGGISRRLDADEEDKEHAHADEDMTERDFLLEVEDGDGGEEEGEETPFRHREEGKREQDAARQDDSPTGTPVGIVELKHVAHLPDDDLQSAVDLAVARSSDGRLSQGVGPPEGLRLLERADGKHHQSRDGEERDGEVDRPCRHVGLLMVGLVAHRLHGERRERQSQRPKEQCPEELPTRHRQVMWEDNEEEQAEEPYRRGQHRRREDIAPAAHDADSHQESHRNNQPDHRRSV